MTIHEVLEYFGGIQPTANAVGVTFQSVHQWKQSEKVPEGRQWQIQTLSAGRLTVDREFLDRPA